MRYVRVPKSQFVQMCIDLDRRLDTSRTTPKPATLLAAAGVRAEEERTQDYIEACDIYGAKDSDVLDTAREFGWDDPDSVEFCAVATTSNRSIVVLQEAVLDDPTTQVTVYVYRTKTDSETDQTMCWFLEAPKVAGTS